MAGLSHHGRPGHHRERVYSNFMSILLDPQTLVPKLLFAQRWGPLLPSTSIIFQPLLVRAVMKLRELDLRSGMFQ